MYHRAQAGMSATPSAGGWSALRREYPRTVAVLATIIALFVVANVAIGARLYRYRAETARLRAGMSDAEKQRTDMVTSAEENKVGVMLELVRRQASGDRGLHLSVSIDSGTMYLERDGALLRDIPVTVGPEKVVGAGASALHIVPPRGVRSVERVMGARDAWEVPDWAFTDRGLTAPADRKLPGALGRNALVLNGGTVIYALPDSGVLADSAYVLPGTVRISRNDLRAIAPIMTRGVTVYFYE
jgi:hypothetical protein